MIRAILFDIGGVILRTVDPAPRRRWEQRLGLGPGELARQVFDSDAGRRAQMGGITPEALWAILGRQWRLAPPDLAQLRRDFWAGDRVDYSLVSLISRLRSRYQTGVVSNAHLGQRRFLAVEAGIAGVFDLIVVSAEEGFMKPTPALFERALARLGRPPAEAAFIDDFPENVAAAAALGLVAIRFQVGLDLAAALRQRGVEIPDGA